MSKLAEFREAERKLQEQLALLEKLKSDSSLKQELEFKDKLQALMDKYGMTLHNIIAILDPRLRSPSAPLRSAVRALKVYKNPNNGEVVETKGGNHKVLKAWKEQYGSETVESWLQRCRFSRRHPADAVGNPLATFALPRQINSATSIRKRS